MRTQDIDYAADGATMRGLLLFEAGASPRPGVLVFHEGLGLDDAHGALSRAVGPAFVGGDAGIV
ncbi:hypothetical protein [Bradyrhizobium sp.]|uniref:hypothetical protein n=1 Tax=Bradyrhizobium sp. TaxID=376 RepID=UPI00403770D7